MLFRGQGTQRQGMDHCVAHVLPQRLVPQLVLLHEALAGKVRGYDQRLEVLAVVAGNAHLRTGEAGLDEALDVFCTCHISLVNRAVLAALAALNLLLPAALVRPCTSQWAVSIRRVGTGLNGHFLQAYFPPGVSY